MRSKIKKLLMLKKYFIKLFMFLNLKKKKNYLLKKNHVLIIFIILLMIRKINRCLCHYSIMLNRRHEKIIPNIIIIATAIPDPPIIAA